MSINGTRVSAFSYLFMVLVYLVLGYLAFINL